MSKRNIPSNYVKLSGRPFLVVTTVRRPADRNVKTHVRGYMDVTGNMETLEQPSVIDRVKARHMIASTVIIDIMRSELITHKFRTDNIHEEIDEDSIVQFYLNRYMEVVKQGVDVYLTNMARGHLTADNLEAAKKHIAAMTGSDKEAVAD